LNRQDAKYPKKGFVGAQRAAPLSLTPVWRAMPLVLVTVCFLLSSCAVVQTQTRTRIALFAPFEGRYREVGYNALYAARLALADLGEIPVDLLPVDDGGTQAVSHAAALAQDPLVMAAIVLGYDGTSPEALAAFGDIPVLVIGNWGAQPNGTNVFIVSNADIPAQLTVSPRIPLIDAAAAPAPLVGGEVFALEGFAKLRESLDGVTILTSGSIPDADFAARYRGSDPFAPEPGLLALLTNYATTQAALAARAGSRSAALHAIAFSDYPGFIGAFRFENGYWADAPINRYKFADGALSEDIVQ
jgi:hypothetical protein